MPASAISVFLLLLVIPVMWFNIRRLRREVRR
jgi:alpha-glucoside transport system permease protein